jgi:hypothetical protein
LTTIRIRTDFFPRRDVVANFFFFFKKKNSLV